MASSSSGSSSGGINLALLGFDLAQSVTGALGRGSQMRTQAGNLRTSAAATRSEAAEARLAAEFDVKKIQEMGFRSAADIEAQFAQAGIGLEQSTMEALIDAETEIALEKEMRARAGRFEEEQLKTEAGSLESQAKDLKKASRKQFLGGIFGF